MDALRDTCRRLLEEGRVQVVVGYGQRTPDGPVTPVFITRPEDCGQLVWNDRCTFNLAVYLTRKEVRALGKPAIVVKGCDERALVVLEKESQIDRGEIVVIGVTCHGVGRTISPLPLAGEGPGVRAVGSGSDCQLPSPLTPLPLAGEGNRESSPKCAACDVHRPQRADVFIDAEVTPPEEPPADRYADLEPLAAQSPEERMAYWQSELGRCIKCYACRRVCPMCYCVQCIAEKNRPVVISPAATLRGNFAWHITRAFHLAGRCVGCDECTRACPMQIDLRRLNLWLRRAAEENFAFRAGVDPDAPPVIGAYSPDDREKFIQ